MQEDKRLEQQNLEVLKRKKIADLKAILELMGLPYNKNARKDELIHIITNSSNKAEETGPEQKKEEVKSPIKKKPTTIIKRNNSLKMLTALNSAKKIEKKNSQEEEASHSKVRENIASREDAVYRAEKTMLEGKMEEKSRKKKDLKDVQGIVDVLADGYGFLRVNEYVMSAEDVYLSHGIIKKYDLKTGDMVQGKAPVEAAGKTYIPLSTVEYINGNEIDANYRRVSFDKLVPIYPNEKIKMSIGDKNNISGDIIDLIAPIGKGQRALIVSPPKAGKTVLLQSLANAISQNCPEAELFILLIDERPEEVTDMQRNTNANVIFSTFDEMPENHVKMSEILLERAMRLVESGKDVVILLDSITRLARAYNVTVPGSGRTLSGGLDPTSLYKPKKFFGAARNVENGGSLTIIATALVDTGSRMDDVIYEEFKGTGNMELHLDRRLAERRIFPAIDIEKSGTRKEELLLTQKELELSWSVRKNVSQTPGEALQGLINMIRKNY